MGLSYAFFKPSEASESEIDTAEVSSSHVKLESHCNGDKPHVVLHEEEEEEFIPNQKDRPTSPQSVLDLGWELVPCLEECQIAALRTVAARGIVWLNSDTKERIWLTLHYGGEVESDGNCLFTSMHRLLDDPMKNLGRKSMSDRLLNDYLGQSIESRLQKDQCIANLYCPDMDQGWGVHIVQEMKLLVRKSKRAELDTAVEDLVSCGVSRENAAETVYKEHGERVENVESWCRYMKISGSEEDEYDLISLHYTEEGLLFVEENREGTKAAFGDDLVLEMMASELNREIYVVQAHGSDGMVSPESSLFFLPHKPKGNIMHPPLFLFMKGTGWCGSGGDHYEPIVARLRDMTGEKPVVEL